LLPLHQLSDAGAVEKRRRLFFYVGAGLDKMSGYSETTSDSQCTQYSSADCDKY